MYHHFKASLATLLSIFLGLLSVTQVSSDSSQSPAQTNQRKTVGNRKIAHDQEQAVLLLKQLFSQTKELDNDETRVETQARIAALLWEYDEATARHQFSEAFTSIEKIRDEESVFQMLGSQNTRLRSEILRRVAEKDPALAEALINSVSESQPSSESPSGIRSKKGKLYLELAQQLIQKQPERAASLIQKDFVNGFSIDLMAMLKQLHRKDAALATRLMRQALTDIQVNPVAPLADFLAIGAYFDPDTNEDRQQKAKDSKAEGTFISPELIEPFLDFAWKAILRQTELDQKEAAEGGRRKRMAMFDLMDQGMVAGLLPLFEKYQPDRAGFIRSRLNQVESRLTAGGRQPLSEYRPKTINDLLEEARKEADLEMRDFLYLEAVEQAQHEENFDQAISISSKIKDKSRTNLSFLYEQAANASARKGNVEAAYRYAKETPEALSRARVFCRIALKAFEKGEKQRANDLLSEAEKLIIQAPAQKEKVSALLDLSASLSKVDTVRGFETLRFTVEFINKNTSAISDSLERYWEGPDESFRLLARSDFYRALSLAQSITHRNIRLLAQLSVCEGFLKLQQAAPAPKKSDAEKMPGQQLKQ
jgi:hypothetical protein